MGAKNWIDYVFEHYTEEANAFGLEREAEELEECYEKMKAIDKGDSDVFLDNLRQLDIAARSKDPWRQYQSALNDFSDITAQITYKIVEKTVYFRHWRHHMGCS